MTTKTILLINDKPNVREVVAACLIHLGGWQVLSVDSPLTGLQRARLEQPDAILLDLSTTSLDNFGFLEKLRSQPATQTIPVVLMTARAKWLDSRLLQQYQVVGVIDHLADPATMLQQITKLLNWNELLNWNDKSEID